MKRLLVSLAIPVGLLAISVAHAAAVRATWTGVVMAGTARDLVVAPGDSISGSFCIDTALAPSDDSTHDPVVGSYETGRRDEGAWLTSRVRVNGIEFRSQQTDLAKTVEFENRDFWPGSDKFHYLDKTFGQSLDDVTFALTAYNDHAMLTSDNLVQAFRWNPSTFPSTSDCHLRVGPPTIPLVDISCALTSLTYTPIAEVLPAVAIVDLPGVEVGEQVFRVGLQTLPGSNPLRFEIVSIAPSTLAAGPGNATFDPANSELHIPAVKLPNGPHLEARLRLVSGTLFLELLSANFTDCS